MKTKNTCQISQIEPSEYVKNLIAEWGVGSIETVDDLIKLRKYLPKVLKELPYTAEVEAAEQEIRWKRTGSKVIDDGYVYATKSCTDIVLAYMTLAVAAGIAGTRFVKVQDPQTTMRHSFAEFKLKDGWYRYNLSVGRAVPEKGAVVAGKPIFFNDIKTPYLLWKKGRDSWSLGLDDYLSGLKIDIKSK
jgi:hypothetical protein